jgi:Flp pilus assembly pilin Flp
MTLVKRFWNDEAGAVLTAEFVLLATVLGIGLITGIATLRDALLTELADLAAAITTMDPSTPAVSQIDGPDGGTGSVGQN